MRFSERFPLRLPLRLPLRFPLQLPLRFPLQFPLRLPMQFPLRLPLQVPERFPLPSLLTPGRLAHRPQLPTPAPGPAQLEVPPAWGPERQPRTACRA